MNSLSLRSLFSGFPIRSLAPLGLAALALSSAPGVAHAVAGVCPDGSAFIVARPEDAPCPQPKFVEPSDLPPLRPEYLPRPYLWYVDQQLRDERNPYNLVDRAKALRELRTGQGAQGQGGQGQAKSAAPATAAAVSMGARPAGRAAAATPAPRGEPKLGPRLADGDLRDLLQLIALRQQVAPATLAIADARGAEQLTLCFAHSASAETRLRSELGLGQGRVLVFSVRAAQAADFYPNFLLAQGGATFRPDPEQATQSGFLLGKAGPLPQGELALGYLVLPDRFDFGAPLRLWWNDRELEVTLQSGS